jgi:prepilin-type N-terminal cleavage/methylation domain-containing protein
MPTPSESTTRSSVTPLTGALIAARRGEAADRACAQRGFTLVEIMVVLGIIAGLSVLAVATLNGLTNSRLDGEALRFSGVLRLVHGRAAINGLRYQVVINLDDASYRVECSTQNVAVPEVGDEGGNEEDQRRRDREQEDPEADPFGLGAQQPTMDDCSEELIEATTLRNGIRFARVFTTHHDEPVEEGEVTIGYFPNGTVERSMIWLTDANGRGWMTMHLDPMTGRVVLRGGEDEIPDDFLELEED